MIRPLPFEGFSWQFTQHAPCFEEKPLIGVLATAALFENSTGYQSELNTKLAHSNYVTQNERDGIQSPWRDYQQVLPEIGLMMSAKQAKALTLTEIGRSLLAGSISHRDALTMQSLRYQYPNGFKAKEIYQKSRDAKVGVRPALTLLRGLLELKKHGINYIDIDQIDTCFLPNRTDAEWQLSVSEILSKPQSRSSKNSVRRNIQDWTKLLGKTHFFEQDGGRIKLSKFGNGNRKALENLADHLIGKPVWYASNENSVSLEWFSYFGTFDSVDENLSKFLEMEAQDVSSIQDQIEIVASSSSSTLALIDFTPINLSLDALPQATDQLLESYMNGQAKLKFAKQEHDKLVNTVAAFYHSLGWSVSHDPGSVDLIAVSPEQAARIIEVKTTTQKTMSKQVRIGVGQVLEYRYRYNLDHPPAAACDIILNRSFANDDWHRAFCAENTINLDSFSIDGYLHDSPI